MSFRSNESSSKDNRESSSEAEEQNKEYSVEKIVDMRIIGGRVEYFLKWRDYDDIHNSWVPEENINNVKILLKAFEKQEMKCNEINEQQRPARKRNARKRNVRKRNVCNSTIASGSSSKFSPHENTKSQPTNKYALTEKDMDGKNDEADDLNNATEAKNKDHNELVESKKTMTAEKIIAATDASGELMFFVKWKGVDEANFISAESANESFPEIVLQFYEERVE